MYNSYYLNQAGSGIPGFQGIQFQRGHGFFGNLFSTIVKPLLGYLGKMALSSGAAIATDVASGRNWKEAAKEHGKSAATRIFAEAAEKMKNNQSGQGFGAARKRRGGGGKRAGGGRKKNRKLNKSIFDASALQEYDTDY